MLAKDIMRKPVCVLEEDTLEDVMKIMEREGVTGVVVQDAEGELKGILTERDFLKALVEPPHPTLALYGIFVVPEETLRKAFRDFKVLHARDIMTKKVLTVDENATLEDISSIMLHNNINHLPVLKGGRVIGMIERNDVLRAFLSERKSE
ncbi:CBS domain-containing protein [bacterium]|nr:CBS domain-containing protein [bacterium]